MSSPPRSPSSNPRASPTSEKPNESAVSRLLIAPLTFISFLLSLALIDSRNHALRTHSHPPPTPTTIFGKIKYFLHRCIYKRTPASPYAYISESSPSKPSKNERERESWYWHTKQRKMMKAELSDAYRMRKSVLIMIVLCGALGVLAMTYTVVYIGAWGWDFWISWKMRGTPSLHTNAKR